jgi:hypothetical protein
MAVSDLNPCVKKILCGLSSAALNALQSVIDGQVALIQAQIVVYQTQLLQYDVLAIPVEVAQQVAQSYIDKVRNSAILLPLNLITECVDLGNFNLNLQQSIDVALATADDLAYEATRLLSYRDDLNAIVQELNAALTQFTDIKTIIGECLGA